jgi:hypothetical protein
MHSHGDRGNEANQLRNMHSHGGPREREMEKKNFKKQ